MRRLELVRRWYEDERTIGELSYRGEFIAFTMEPGKADHEFPRVPPGFYYLERHGWLGEPVRYERTWALIGRDVSHQREAGIERCAVLFHAGNRDDDTLGCIIPGMTIGRLKGETAVLGSRDAMVRLRTILGDADGFLVIRGG